MLCSKAQPCTRKRWSHVTGGDRCAAVQPPARWGVRVGLKGLCGVGFTTVLCLAGWTAGGRMRGGRGCGAPGACMHAEACHR